MTEYSPGTIKIWHNKWQGHINYRVSPDDSWHKKAKVLTAYHEADPSHPGRVREVKLPAPTGRISKKMEDDARLALKEWRDELVGTPARLGDEKTTVAAYVEHYIDVLENTEAVEASTLGVYRQMLKTIKNYDIGAIKLDDLEAEDAEKWIADLLADDRARSSIRKAFNLIHAAVKHAVSSKRLHGDPLASVRTPKLVNKEPNSLDDAMRAKLVSYLDITGPTTPNVGYALALYTGMREGEICGLRWRDVDLKNRVIHVRNVIAHDGPKCYEKEPKTKNGRRDIPFNEDLAKTISARLAAARLECEEAGVELAPDMYVIGSVDDGRGKYMHPHTLWQGWKANATSLGLKGVRGKTPSFHDLRHTYATVAAHLPGADLKGVQMNLGHASIKTTMDIYASDNPEARRAVAMATADAIREIPEGAKVIRLAEAQG